MIAVPAAFAVAGGVISLAAVHPGSQIFGKTIHSTSAPGQFALTFDDGPNPAITPRLLELLERHQVRATFFVVGRFVRECLSLTKEIAARGHLVCNHTETHPNLFWLGPAGVREELVRCQDSLQGALGGPPAFFRPPFGYRNPWVVSAARQLGMQTVLWTLLPGDWRAPNSEWLARRMDPIARHARNAEGRGFGDVLCLHDGDYHTLGGDRRHTLDALEYWLPRWRDLGLKFVTIGEAASAPAN